MSDYRWRITAREYLGTGQGLGRPIDLAWVDGVGLIAMSPESQWAAETVIALNGRLAFMRPVGPNFTVDLNDPRLVFWAAASLAVGPGKVEGERPAPLADDTPARADN
jgi:hypothetical protein